MASNCIDDVCDSFGEPNISPRIGDEYQAELPQIIGVSDYIANSRNYVNTEARAHSYENFFVGLAIPLTSLKQDGPEIILDIKQTDPKNITKTVQDLVKPKDKPQSVLVPGLIGDFWSDAEKASFNLGLYIFEKKFVEVRRFIETKKMCDILSYYYGEFYCSAEYVRWSDRRETKGKKYVFGQRIFSGLRQQELLSRLVPRLSEECKSALLEVSKTFEDEKMSLVDYVTSLKAMVGIKVLVEAIGIGEGKKDLTRMALEPSRSDKVIPARTKIPIGKAWASLKTSEIIEFLHGNYRLSKARSNDMFWEAVWPRLLARGWHSEQPQSEGYNSSKHYLVFLMPGVEKFSRMELVKGDHYFDSVTDVLGKVAKEPGLINLENEEVNDFKSKEEHESNGSENKPKEKGNDQRQFYLRPRTSNRSMHAVKFTVADTSPGGKLRDLRTLPSIEDRDQDNLEEKNGGSDLKNNKDLDDKMKFRRARKQKQDNVDCKALISKRCRRLTADTHEETRDGVIHSSTSDNGPSCHNLSSLPSSARDKLSSFGPSKGSPSESTKCDPNPIGDSRPSEPSTENSRPRLSIDLNNLPQEESQESEQDNPTIMPDSNNEARNEHHCIVNMNPPRQSTRTRPLTTKALEAIAYGYLTASRKRKGKITNSDEGLASRLSKRARGGVRPNDCPNSTSMVSQVKEGENDVANGGNYNTASGVRVLPNGK